MKTSYLFSKLRFGLFSFSVFCLLMPGCQQGSERPHVLVIAVDSLKFDDIRCSSLEANPKSAFSVLCEEAVRFTHAFTPSPLAQPAMSSLLTAKYPFESGVWDNGKSYLKESVVTAAELAHRNGYRTAFFSGGPPLFSKSGLNQGFNLFSDSINLQKGLFRRTLSVLAAFKKWFRTRSSQPAFSVLFLADLQFPNEETVSFEGVHRESTLNGQLSDLDEKLGHFFHWMKQENIWDNSYIFFLGLNGRAHARRPGFVAASNIFSENTLVSLFIKPKRKRRDLGLRWNIDTNVSLVDVGQTIFDLVSEQQSSGRLAESLLPAISELKPVGFSSRNIYVESGWLSWFEMGDSVFASRRNQLFFIHDIPGTLYNSLLDPTEILKVQAKDPEAIKLVEETRRFFLEKSVPKYSPAKESLSDKLAVAKSVFAKMKMDATDKGLLSALMKQRPWDYDLIGWVGHLAVLNNDWKSLARIGRQSRLRDWTFVAEANLGRSSYAEHECLQLDEDIQSCKDTTAKLLRVWMDERQPKRLRELSREKFIREYRALRLQREIEARNYVNDLTWFKIKESKLVPSLSDLLLALPINRDRRRIVNIRSQLISR